MAQPTLTRLHVIVKGRVQGVNFRAYTRRKALELGLTGWVRNLMDGTVETIAEGSEDKLAIFVEFLQSGSPSASVTGINLDWQTANGEFDDFQIRYF